MKSAWIGRWVAFGLLLSGTGAVRAQTDRYEGQIQHVLKAIYTVDDQTVNAALQELQNLRPGFPAPLVYRELMDSWHAADDPLNETLIKLFEADADKAIAGCLLWIHDHPTDAEAWRYLSSAYGQRARFAEKIQFKHRSAIEYGLKTRKAVDMAYALDRNDADILVGVGGAHFFAAHLPYTLRFFAWLLGFHGDRNAGLRELAFAMTNGRHSHVEGAMVLAGAYWTESDYENFQKIVSSVASQNTRLLSVRAWQVEGWMCANQLSDSRLNEAIEAAQAGDGWKSLQRGRIALARGDWQKSAESFSQALSSADANLSVRALACKGLGKVKQDAKSNRAASRECPAITVPDELSSRTFPTPGKCRH